MVHRLILPLCAALLIALVPGVRAWAAESGAQSHRCVIAAARASAAHGLPGGLLNAISLAETGRWDPAKKASFAWPWTVTSGGAGTFFPTKAAAIAHVKALKGEGVRNIDVGCMQVNLKYHPDAFANLETAFDPMANARYAAQLLAGLNRQTKSWQRAIGRYHSATPSRSGPYLEKVTRLWLGEQQIARKEKNDAQAKQARARHAAAEQSVIDRQAAAERHRADVIARFLDRRNGRIAVALGPPKDPNI